MFFKIFLIFIFAPFVSILLILLLAGLMIIWEAMFEYACVIIDLIFFNDFPKRKHGISHDNNRAVLFKTRKMEGTKVILAFIVALLICALSGIMADFFIKNINGKATLTPILLLFFAIFRVFGSGMVAYMGVTRTDRKLKLAENVILCVGIIMLFLKPLAIFLFSF